MTRWASVVREADGLDRLAAFLDRAIAGRMSTRADFEDAALTVTAQAVAAAALARTGATWLSPPQRLPGHRSGAGRSRSTCAPAPTTSPSPARDAVTAMTRSTPGALNATRRVRSRGLDEDLRGPDVTTESTVPADATTIGSLVARETGVAAGVDVALMVLDEVLGPDGYQVLERVQDGTRLEAGQGTC